jgi:hypothetical protein
MAIWQAHFGGIVMADITSWRLPELRFRSRQEGRHPASVEVRHSRRIRIVGAD